MVLLSKRANTPTRSREQVAQAGLVDPQINRAADPRIGSRAEVAGLPVASRTRNRLQLPLIDSPQALSSHPIILQTEIQPQIPPIDPTKPESGRPLAIGPEKQRQVVSAGLQTGHSAVPAGPIAIRSLPPVSTGLDRPQTVRRPPGGELPAVKEQKAQVAHNPQAGRESRAGYSADGKGPQSLKSKVKTAVQSTGASDSQVRQASLARSESIPTAQGGRSASSTVRRQDESFTRNSKQFRPKPDQGMMLVPGVIPSYGNRRPTSKIGIGIETEFMLKAIQPEHRADTMVEFARIIATNHNKYVEGQHPRMSENASHWPVDPSPFDRWVLKFDPSIMREVEPCKPLYSKSTLRDHVDELSLIRVRRGDRNGITAFCCLSQVAMAEPC